MQQYMVETSQISNNKIFLTKDNQHHIFKVMRMSEQSQFYCVDYLTQIRYLVEINKNLEFEIVKQINQNNGPFHLTVYF